MGTAYPSYSETKLKECAASLDYRIIRTFVKKLVEIGACVWAFATGPEPALLAVLLLAANYLGALTYRVVEIHRGWPTSEFVVLPSLLILGIGYWLNNDVYAALGLAGFGFGLADREATSRTLNPSAPKLVKIAAKFAGMVCAALIVASVGIYILLAIALSTMLVLSNSRTVPIISGPRYPALKLIDLANLFHQAAYFAFCFVFWCLSPQISPPEIALLFPIGWVLFWIMEIRLTSRKQQFRPLLLAAGHLAFSGTLMAMTAMKDSPWLLMGAWLLTGIFAGTSHTMQKTPGRAPSRLSDEAGAAMGTVLAVTAIWGSGSAMSALSVASCLAACAAMRTFVQDAARRDR